MPFVLKVMSMEKSLVTPFERPSPSKIIITATAATAAAAITTKLIQCAMKIK